MDIRKIRKLIELIKETGVSEIEVKSADESVCIKQNSAPTNAPIIMQAAQQPTATPAPIAPSGGHAEQPATPAPVTGYQMTSPMVGTVYLASTPGAKPFVEIGQHVEIGDTLCMIEAMKMYNPIEADKAGVISARMIENEQPVEYDQTLFIIDPDD